MSLLVRSFIHWLLLLTSAVLNGTVRQALLVPAIGEHAGHIVSTVALAGIIFVVGWLTSAWLNLVSWREAWLVGSVWLVLTVAFEFLGGHFLFGTPWPKLLADYDLTRGRMWIVVLVVTALTPPIVYRLDR